MRKFNRLSDEVLKFERKFSELPTNSHSQVSVEIQKEELKALWVNFKSTYEFIMDSGDSSTNRNDMELSFNVGYQAYLSCSVKISEFMQLFQSRNALTSTQLNVTEGHSATLLNQSLPSFHIQPPVCDTEVFKGDYLTWPSFRDLFTAIYISNPRLSDVEKLLHLTHKTKGEAKEIVMKSPLTNEGFSQAWENLKTRYENKRILVNSQLKILFNLSPINKESSAEIKQMQRDINNCLSALQLYKIDTKGWDAILVFLCSTKLPSLSLSLWEQSIQDKTDIPKWSDMDKFLTSRFHTLEVVSDMRHSSNHGSSKNKNSDAQPSSSKNVKSFLAKSEKSNCYFCSSSQHFIKVCPDFLKLKPNERFNSVKRLRLCFVCLSPAHSSKECKSSKTCSKCKKKHNDLLHKDSANKGQGSSNKQKSSSQNVQSHLEMVESDDCENIQTCFAKNAKRVILGTAMVNLIHLGEVFSVRALIDPGSEATFISENLQARLKLPCGKISARVSGLNDAVAGKISKMCDLVLGSRLDSSIKINVSAFVMKKLTGSIPSRTIELNCADINFEWQLADRNFHKSGEVDILIGADVYPQIIREGLKYNILGSLLAQNTIFGFVLTGPMPQNTVNVHCCNIVTFFNEISLDEQLAKFWEIEELPKRKFKTDEEIFCEDYYKNTTKRNDDGRYVVSLPFKPNYEDKTPLGCSRFIAERQFLRNEVSLLKKPEFKKEYDQVLLEYLDLGHMTRVNVPEKDSSCFYYMPHHAVIKPESTSTKTRVVFNASSKSSTGVSLNDVLYTGPVLQNDLTQLLIKWRFFKYVFNGDIVKMYRQILVGQKDSSFQRILFRTSPDGALEDYELNTVTFGVNCAPYLAIRTLLQLAEDEGGKYPVAAEILKYWMYVDDALYGAHGVTDAMEARRELAAVLSSAGLVMRKWTSNCEEVLAEIPKGERLTEDFLDFEESSSTKTLGIRWNAKSDVFYFSIVTFEIKENYTKREVVSITAKIFDPVGFLAPIVIQAKMLMQGLWKKKIDWDQKIPEDSLIEWKQFLRNHNFINQVKIPRWINFSPNCEIEVHGFSDSSEKAYGACVYVRVKVGFSNWICNLIFAKSRVAPVKVVSLPRLELCGAVLLAEMLNSLIKELKLDGKRVVCWTDSTIVLAWLKKLPTDLNCFVANRVVKIDENIGLRCWRHVDSKSNPADLVSRGVNAPDLKNNSLWWHGPEWLLSENHWPVGPENQIFETTEEIRKVKAHFTYFKDYEDPLNRFSKFATAMRVMSYVFRFISRLKSRKQPDLPIYRGELTAIEIESTKEKLIILCQKVHFPDEYNSLFNKKDLNKKSCLMSLNPFLDEKGFLRVGGRLAFAPKIFVKERHQIILPYNCQFSRLYTQFVHEVTLHGGNQLMLRILRYQFWILKAKNLIRTIIRNCKKCVLYKKAVGKQIMASLPVERVSNPVCFETTGVDFAGPFEIKNFHGRGCRYTKGYVCLFVCFSTKAIHLEAVSDLSTASFLAAFSRFVGRRGCPSKIYSDNGTNFVGASRELKQEFKLFMEQSQKLTLSTYAHQGVSWFFNPPGAPHMGGLWEAGVKSFKHHFKRIAGGLAYTLEEFSTLLVKIEACLNSRPLSPQSEDADDLTAITAGHLLTGRLLLAPAEPLIEEQPLSIINRWRRVKAMYQHFVNRWKNEYLLELQKRYKWQFKERNLQINDLVVVMEENSHPHEWRLGRIVNVHPGKDDIVRVVSVKTLKGIIKRPIAKLVFLPPQ